MISATSSANIIPLLSTATFECDGDKIIQVPPFREKHIMHEIMEEVHVIDHYCVEDRSDMLMMMSFFSILNSSFDNEMAI